MRQKLLLVVAVFFGLLAFFLTYQQISQEKKRIRGSTVELNLIVTTRSLAEGETITAGDLAENRIRRFPKDVSDNDVRWEDRARIIGQKLGRSIGRGEIVRYYDLAMLGSRRGGLASIIDQGERAISIAVDATSSVTGLISPDDNVDIIGTFRFPDMKGDQALDTITMTILQNVRVLATGTEMGQTASMPGRRTQARAKGYSTVSLALTPKEVEMIIFASQKGRLCLSLRNTEETKVEGDLQSVNFRFLEQNIPRYTQERQQRKLGRRN